MADAAGIVQDIVIGLSNGLIIALVALGYTMVYGIIELINFAHGDLVMLGCFCALTLVGAVGAQHVAPGGGNAWMTFVALLVLVPAFCAALNWLVERTVYRPMRAAPKLTVLVSAIGVSFIFVNLGLFWGGAPMEVFGFGRSAASPKTFPDLLPTANLLGHGARVVITAKEIAVACVVLPLLGALTWLVKATRLGRAMRATAQDPLAAKLMGIDVDRVVSATFVIGGALAGVAAVFYPLYNNISFQTGFRAGMDAFTAAVLGGIGNLPGAVLGSVLIGLVRAFSDRLLSQEWSSVVVFSVLILLLVFRPSGLLGATRREKV